MAPTDEEKRYLSSFLGRQEELFRADPNAEWQKKIKASRMPRPGRARRNGQVLMASTFLRVDSPLI